MDDGHSWSRAAGGLGYVHIGALAIVDTGDRTILYVGTTGGFISQDTAVAAGFSASETSINPGVYRFTTLNPSEWLYLPTVFR